MKLFVKRFLNLIVLLKKILKISEAECHRHIQSQTQSTKCERRHATSTSISFNGFSSSSSSTTSTTKMFFDLHQYHVQLKNVDVLEQRMQMEKTITTRTRSAPRLNFMANESMNSLRRIDMIKKWSNDNAL